MAHHVIAAPVSETTARQMASGDTVSINGVIYTARDAAHNRLVDLINRGHKLPVDLMGQIIYYAGPAPAKPGRAIGPAGPTTSVRMDAYTPALLSVGLRVMVGKGRRAPEVICAMRKHGAVYLAATGGAAALISESIVKAEVVAYEDLGTEAIHRLVVRDFPAIVVIDTRGNDLYETEPPKYARNV